jgi:hypothetical protein
MVAFPTTSAVMKLKIARKTSTLAFEELPSDIVILILCQCHIDALLTLRLTSSKLHDLITERIKTIAPSVARSSFPSSKLLVTPPDGLSSYSINWLKNLIPNQLASVLVDRCRLVNPWALNGFGIPAEDARGNELRSRVANGWRVLRRLTKISEDVYAMDTNVFISGSKALQTTRSKSFKSVILRQREELVLKQRLAYIEKLDPQLKKDYKLMLILLSTAFNPTNTEVGDNHMPWIFDFGKGIDVPRQIRLGSSWMTWYILNQGPDLFWQQWVALDRGSGRTKHYIRDRAIEAWFKGTGISPEDHIRRLKPEDWRDVSEERHTIQRDHAGKVQTAIQDTASGQNEDHADFEAVNPMPYLAKYAAQRLIGLSNGEAQVEETLTDLPFHVSFMSEAVWTRKFSSTS